MNRKALLVTVAATAMTLVGSTAAATPPKDLDSKPIVRAAAGVFLMADRDMRFVLGAGKPTDIVLVRATIEVGGFTGWHDHLGRSLVIVEKGVMTVQEARHNKCLTKTVSAGKSFEHPDGPHNFINNGTEQIVFYVVYFVPAGAAPSPIDSPAPGACA
jgi:quercetin dioxygenase-like cupin family protein